MITLPIKVRYYETDKQGIVHHSNYLRWFECGREALVEQAGSTFKELEDMGLFFVLRNAELTYKLPVAYGDTVELRVYLVGYNNVRINNRYEVFNNNELCATGTTELIAVAQDTMKPVQLRKKLPTLHKKFIMMKDEE